MISDVVDPGITRLAAPMGSRWLAFYVLDGEGSCTVFDAALPGWIVRWLEDGSRAERVTQLVISHADADHVGDAAALRARCHDLAILCHPRDRRWVENHDLLVQERYGEACGRFGFRCGDPLAGLRDLCGPDFTATSLLMDGERLAIGSRVWEVLHVPGHTPGHIALWDARGEVLIFGDAALGSAIPDVDGHPSMPPTHRYIGDYLSTIDRLMQLPVRLALSAHWPPLDGSEFRRLLEQSRACVERDLAAVSSACRQRSRAFSDLVELLNDRHRLWPASEDAQYAIAVIGYIEHLLGRGALSRDHEGRFAA